jgi:hypothetical protein
LSWLEAQDTGSLLDPLAPNSPAKSGGLVANNNEIYKSGEFRVQRQGRAPRSAANNNEYQRGE